MKPDPSTPKRSVAKAISWETFSNLVCGGLAYMMFGNLGGCVAFTLICFVLKVVMFYWHERLWHRCPWGKLDK